MANETPTQIDLTAYGPDEIWAMVQNGQIKFMELPPIVQQEITAYLQQNPELKYVTGTSPVGTSGDTSGLPPAPSLEDLLGQLTATTDPVISNASALYFQLFGVAPPPDVVSSWEGGNFYDIRDQLVAQAGEQKAGGYVDYRYNKLVGNGEQLYFSLWGEDPAPGYIDGLINKGMNLFEIEENERSKPAWLNTTAAKNEAVDRANAIQDFLGLGF